MSSQLSRSRRSSSRRTRSRSIIQPIYDDTVNNQQTKFKLFRAIYRTRSRRLEERLAALIEWILQSSDEKLQHKYQQALQDLIDARESKLQISYELNDTKIVIERMVQESMMINNQKENNRINENDQEERTEINRLRMEKRLDADKISKLRQKLRDMNESSDQSIHIQEMKVRRCQLTEEKLAAINQLTEKDREIEALKQALKRERSNAERRVSHSASSKGSQVNDYKMQIHRLEDKLSDAYAGFDNSELIKKEEQIDALKQQLAETEQILRDERSAVENMRRESFDLKKRVSQSLSAKEMEVNDLKESNSDAVSEIHAMKDIFERQRAGEQKLKSEFNATQHELKEIKRRYEQDHARQEGLKRGLREEADLLQREATQRNKDLSAHFSKLDEISGHGSHQRKSKYAHDY